MTRNLRKTHLAAWLALALAIAGILAASVAFRHAAPTNPAVPTRRGGNESTER